MTIANYREGALLTVELTYDAVLTFADALYGHLCSFRLVGACAGSMLICCGQFQAANKDAVLYCVHDDTIMLLREHRGARVLPLVTGALEGCIWQSYVGAFGPSW